MHSLSLVFCEQNVRFMWRILKHTFMIGQRRILLPLFNPDRYTCVQYNHMTIPSSCLLHMRCNIWIFREMSNNRRISFFLVIRTEIVEVYRKFFIKLMFLFWNKIYSIFEKKIARYCKDALLRHGFRAVLYINLSGLKTSGACQYLYSSFNHKR